MVTTSLIPASIKSPGTTGPIPGGDPVNMRSLGSKVMYCDMKLINCGTLNIKSDVFPLCTSLPFTLQNISTFEGSGISSLLIKRLTGQAVSKPLPIVHGKPEDLATVWNYSLNEYIS